MGDKTHVFTLKQPLLFGLGHGILFSMSFCSFLTYFCIAEYNDPITGELVLRHQYQWLYYLSSFMMYAGMVLGIALVVINIIAAVRNKCVKHKILHILISLIVAVLTAILLCVLGMFLVELLIQYMKGNTYG